MTLRLVTYNVRYFGHALKGLASTARSAAGIAEALAGLTPLPDLVALQEVETRSLRASTVHRGAHPDELQLQAFLRHLGQALTRRGVRLPYRAWYFPAHVYRLGRVTFYTTGLAVLVNVERLHVVADNVARPHHVTHHGSARLRRVKQSRIAAHLALETLEGRAFHLFNTHLSLPTPWAARFWGQRAKMGFGANQLAEARALCAFVHATAGAAPRLVVGDFNSAPGTPVYRALREEGGLQGAQEALGQLDPGRPTAFPTAGFAALRMHLDHVFGGGGIHFLDLEGTRPFGDLDSPFHGLSDHVPLLTAFEVEG
jgi:endonuclease/exonuclease/phosphatase family metal-dependent hydrolase